MWPCHSWVTLSHWTMKSWSSLIPCKLNTLPHGELLCIPSIFVIKSLFYGEKHYVYWKLCIDYKLCMISANSHWCSKWSSRFNWSKGSTWSIWWPWSSRLTRTSRPNRSPWFTWFLWSPRSPRAPVHVVHLPHDDTLDILNHVMVWLSEWMSALNFDFDKHKSRSLNRVPIHRVSSRPFSYDSNNLKNIPPR